MFRVMMLCY